MQRSQAQRLLLAPPAVAATRGFHTWNLKLSVDTLLWVGWENAVVSVTHIDPDSATECAALKGWCARTRTHTPAAETGPGVVRSSQAGQEWRQGKQPSSGLKEDRGQNAATSLKLLEVVWYLRGRGGRGALRRPLGQGQVTDQGAAWEACLGFPRLLRRERRPAVQLQATCFAHLSAGDGHQA